MNNRIKHCVMYAILAACAVITVSGATAAASSGSGSGSQSSAVTDRQRIYMAHLRTEGYSPSIDDDGDISFQSGGLNCYILIDSNDQALLYLLLPSIQYLNSDAEKRRAADAISVVNRQVKVGKAFIAGTQQSRQWVTVGAEAFLENPDHFAVIFGRLMRATIRAKEVFDENW